MICPKRAPTHKQVFSFPCDDAAWTVFWREERRHHEVSPARTQDLVTIRPP